MKTNIHELREKVILFIYQKYEMGVLSNTTLYISEKEMMEEIECPVSKIKTIIKSLQADGVIKEVTVGYVPIKTMPSGQAVFTTSQSSPDYLNIGYKITIDKKKLEKIGSLIHSKFTDSSTADTVEFDSLTGVIKFGIRTHKFHKKNPERLKLFMELWEERRQLKKSKEIHNGKRFPPETYATRIDLIGSAQDFYKNKKAQKSFFNLIKGINRDLQSKKIPAHIERENNIQLIVTE